MILQLGVTGDLRKPLFRISCIQQSEHLEGFRGEFRYKNIFLLGKAIKWHSCSSHYKSNWGQLPLPTICLNKLALVFVSQVPFDLGLILPALVTECFAFRCERSQIYQEVSKPGKPQNAVSVNVNIHGLIFLLKTLLFKEKSG